MHFFVASGNWFHERDAVHENEPSNIAVFDLDTAKEPFEVDLSVRVCACDIGISSSGKYVGVRLLYVSTVNMSEEAVS